MKKKRTNGVKILIETMDSRAYVHVGSTVRPRSAENNWTTEGYQVGEAINAVPKDLRAWAQQKLVKRKGKISAHIEKLEEQISNLANEYHTILEAIADNEVIIHRGRE